MNKRISSIDILRGIAIIGMIFCANIGFNSGLPGWMFHAQTPPPAYDFDPSAAGLTWVDLVFPFFLFSMGAAFPLAMRKKFENGATIKSVAMQLFKRWAILTLFALIIGNTSYTIWNTSRPGWQANLFLIAVWAALFPALVRTRWKWVNLAGAALICSLGFILYFWFGITPDKGTSDIIIMILANVALWGGFIWALTRNSLRLRWLVILFVAAAKAAFSYIPELAALKPGCLAWLFNPEWLQYLLIALPGSIAGDLILGHSRSGKSMAREAEEGKPAVGNRSILTSAFIAIIAVLAQLWGLHLRFVITDFIGTALLAAAFYILVRRDWSIYKTLGMTGFILLLTGIAFDPLDGGITKDYCNLSYLFTTGGMAMLATAVLVLLEFRFNLRCSFISGIGQNPMVAYTVTSYVIGPVFRLLGIMPLLFSLSEGNQFWGIVQGIILTSLMMGATWLCTKLKLFWKS
ncbi:MAG: DUF5009 domain-containing protein [Candidatus Cryptobacteroides sp.]